MLHTKNQPSGRPVLGKAGKELEGAPETTETHTKRFPESLAPAVEWPQDSSSNYDGTDGGRARESPSCAALWSLEQVLPAQGRMGGGDISGHTGVRGASGGVVKELGNGT